MKKLELENNNKKGTGFSFEVPEDADMSNPVHAFATSINQF